MDDATWTLKALCAKCFTVGQYNCNCEASDTRAGLLSRLDGPASRLVCSWLKYLAAHCLGDRLQQIVDFSRVD